MPLRYGKNQIPVLFENDSCLVLNKPAGLPVQGGEGVRVSLDSILSESISPRPLLIHRLDRDTSGIILVAKSKTAAAAFSALFEGSGRSRGIVKQYHSVCSGVPEPKEGAIRLDLEFRGNYRTKTKKKSETFYRLVSTMDAREKIGNMVGISEETGQGLFSLLELELGTGRMHQIRRHLAKTGNPVLGDDKYGDFSLNKKLKKIFGLKRLLLHASRLIIPPSPHLVPDGLDITAMLPSYFSPFLSC